MAIRVSTEAQLQKLRQALIRRGPSTREELCRDVGISQPVFSRLVRRSAALDDTLLQTGKARKTRYALLRTVMGVDTPIPVFRVDSSGKASQVGDLVAVQERGFAWSGEFYPDLPYLLNDLIPAGFLGRLIPALHPELNLPSDVNQWSTDDALRYLTRFGSDTIGDWILGEPAFRRHQDSRGEKLSTLKRAQRSKKYEELAQDVMSLGVPGSSAGGEQPKFMKTVDDFPVIVKFSPPTGESIGARIADLLICEHLALKTFQGTDSELVFGEDRVFLELQRFDRTPQGGRKGLISLRALGLHHLGSQGSWTEIATGLLARRVISSQNHTAIVRLDLLGGLIANSDRHPGNLSFFIKDGKPSGLTPLYDMLPMLYAPQQNQLVERIFSPPRPLPRDVPHWKWALPLAQAFWFKVTEHPKISRLFKQIAKQNQQILKEREKDLELLR